MTTAIKRRRGTTAQHATFTGLDGEVTIDTTKKVVVVHDGVTPGGFPSITPAEMSLKANLASPTFTGVPAIPTAVAGTNTDQAASTAFVRTEISNLIASAPTALDTLNELAAAMGNDPNFATTVTNSLATKAPKESPTFTGTVSGVTKAMVGLGNADDTSDANKPVSTAQQTALNLKQDVSGKDATGGYAGLTLFKINFKNAADTFTSFFTNTNTAARTYTFPDKNITVAGIDDITGTNSGTNTGDETSTTIKTKLGISTLSGANTGDQTLGSLGAEASANKDATGGYAGLTLFKLNLKNTAGTVTNFFTNATTAARTWTLPDYDGTVAMLSDFMTSVTGSIKLSAGTTAERDPSPQVGWMRYNKTIGAPEVYNQSGWGAVGGGATGGGGDRVFHENSGFVRNNHVIGESAYVPSVTVTLATPGVFTLADHGFVADMPVHLRTTGALPTGLAVDTVYYVLSAGLTANTFQLSLTQGGAAITTSGSQSGIHSIGQITHAVVAGQLVVGSGASVTVENGSSLVVVK